MKIFNLKDLVRDNILALQPYSSARSDFKGKAEVFLDANENSFGSASEELFNRYPDPYQLNLKNAISGIKNIPAENIFLGNGSDEPIDILYRVFCNPGVDNVIVNPPTYGMYEVSANINNVSLRKVNLTNDYQLDITSIFKTIDEHTKMIFVCCPNNPTATPVKSKDIFEILNRFNGIVILDEAYIDFASYSSLLSKLSEYPNLVILQTFSKAWGLAGLRLGMCFASKEIIHFMNKVKPPYNISGLTQTTVLNAIRNKNKIDGHVNEIICERKILSDALPKFPFVRKVLPSEANFILIKVSNAKHLYHFLLDNGIVVRDRSTNVLCEEGLRITVGTKVENLQLLDVLKKYKNE
jgi:histidinol-phosphate aminotransferase